MADLSPRLLPAPPKWFTDHVPADESLFAYEQALSSPARREIWKYTPATKVVALAELATQRPTIAASQHPGIDLLQQPSSNITALFNIAQAPEAFATLCRNPLLYVRVSESLDQPLSIRHTASSWPLVIDVAAGVAVTITEEFASDNDQQQVIWLRVGRDAQVTHARNSLSATPQHWQFLSVQVQANGYYRLHNHAVASPLRRQDIQIQLCGDGASAELSGAAMIDARHRLDQQITVEHVSAHTTSQQNFHTIVADRGQSTFNGRIHIHEGARKSNANLSNKNIGLGNNSTINTKPELEIYNDDVSCAHGATIGQLDDSQLFYLCSRGVSPSAARQLLCEGFLQQCVGGPLADSANRGLLQPLQKLDI